MCIAVFWPDVDENLVISIVSSGAEVPKRFKSCYDKVFSQHVKNVKRQPTIEEIRNIQAATYAICNEI